jgi:diguanylate cyclase (GGDEF)-like protein
MATQRRLLAPELPVAVLRRRATMLLAADLLAVYLISTTFTADPQWIGFYFYPLMSLEAAIIAGLWAGLGVTLLSVNIYLAQLVLHTSIVGAFELRSALASVSMIAMLGGFMTLYAHLVVRGRSHLRAMLHLTSALARHERQSDVIRDLDRRLHTTLGARVRSLALREAGGGFRIAQWHTAEELTLSWAQLERVFGDAEALARHLEVGESLTVETDAWSVLTATLGLPEWAASITFVPIMAEGRWVGVLPVLWPTRTFPDADQLRLLNGLAGQMGLAMARRELESMRRDSTVDPLTGFLNRRAISAELDAFVARAARADGRLAVVLCDLDPVSESADPAGATMRTVATAIRGVLRNGDVAGRCDDDRLLLIAADANAAAAHTLGARITAAVAAVPATAGLRVTIGVAAWPNDGPTAGDLVDAADAAIEAVAPRSSAHAYLAATAEMATSL